MPVSHSDQFGGRLSSSTLVGAKQVGDIMFGALLPFHLDLEYPVAHFTESPPRGACKMFSFEVLQQFQALRFAVEEINRSPDLLPNISLGFQVYDSCAGLQQEIDGTQMLLTGQEKGIPNYFCQEGPPVAAIIGHSISTFSILMAHMLGLYRYPQISHFSTSSLLSDRTQFPSFFRTVPSDAFQSKGLAQMVLLFGWTWVGLVAVSEDYGQQGIQVIKQEILKAGACVAFTEYIITNRQDKNAPYLTKVIKESTAKTVIVFSTDAEMVPLLDEMLKQNVTGKILVASEAWSTSTVLSDSKYPLIIGGSIGFSFQSSTISNFQQYLNNIHPLGAPEDLWTKLLWESTFACKLIDQEIDVNELNYSTKLCTKNESLFNIQNSYNDVSNLRGAQNLYAAVYVIAKALHVLLMCEEQKCSFNSRNSASIQNLKPWKLSQYIQRLRMTLASGREIFFNGNGDPPGAYDIVNWQINSKGIMVQAKVGSYDTTLANGSTFSIDASAIIWPSGANQVPQSMCSKSCLPGFRKVVKRGLSICCFECVTCPQGEISNQTASNDCTKCPWDQWPDLQKDKCLDKEIEFLSYDTPLGAALAASSVFSSSIPTYIFGLLFHYKNTPIVRANNYSLSCLLLLSLCLCFLCSLAFIGYPSPEKCILRQSAFGIAFALCVSCILAKTIMVVFAFMATKPGSELKKLTSPRVSNIIIVLCTFVQLTLCVLWMSLFPPFPQQNLETQPEIIIVECNEGSPIAFWCMLAYLGLLASISFIVAFFARRLPSSFNEAKFITFSMLAFLSVWLSFIPAYLSASGKYTVAMEIFAIQSSSWALMVCMFLPKCFIVLFRPSMNSREYLMGKTKG